MSSRPLRPTALVFILASAACSSGGAAVNDVLPTGDSGGAAVRDATSGCKGCDAHHGADGARDATRAEGGASAESGPSLDGATDAALPGVDGDVDAGTSDATVHVEAGVDAGHVVEHDAGHDAGHVVEHDAGHDAGHVVEHDAGHDAHGVAHDAGHDSGSASGLPGTHLVGQTISVKTGSGTVTRTYDVTLPTVCTSAKPVPLVFMFHGDGGKGSDMYGANFPIEAAAAAADDTAIFVYPNGTNNNVDPDGAAHAWNVYTDPGYFPYTAADPPTPDNDDIDFLDAMVAYFEQHSCAESSRIYITGMSAGGYAANQFARWRSNYVAGTAPQSGGAPFGNPDGDPGPNGSDFAPPNYCVGTTHAVPALIIHGAADTEVDPSNGVQAQGYWEMANTCTGYANNCDNGNLGATCATQATTPSPCISAVGCKDQVVFCEIPGLGHAIWSQAAVTIWTFFSKL